MKIAKSFILITLVIGGLVLFAQETRAGITISPVTFELTANPGDILFNKIKVHNPGGNTIAIRMEIEDFRPVGELGQVVVTEDEEMTYSLKRWTKADPAEFTLGPNEQKFVQFTINVPENAEPGGKYGSVLASTVGVSGPGITGAAIAQKVGSLVLLMVSGQVTENVLVEEFNTAPFLEYGPVPFIIKFKNTGTVHVKPGGFVTISDWRGKKAADVEFPRQNIIPGAVRKVTASWDKKWLFGRYTATLVGNYGTGNLPIEPPVITFWAFPWKLAVGLFLASVLLMTYFIKTRKRWRLALRILFKGEQ